MRKYAMMTIKKFENILELVDFKNEDDFGTFTEVLYDMNTDLERGDIDEILDFLIFEMDINSDADLYDLSKSQVRNIVFGINLALTNVE